MNNPLFIADCDDWYVNLDFNFKKRCLFYEIKHNYVWLMKDIDNYELVDFIKSKNRSNNFANYIKFFEKYFKDNFYFDIFEKLLFTVFAENIESIIKKWYILKNDFEKVCQRKEFKDYKFETNRNSHTATLKITYNKIMQNFNFAKKELFFDFTQDNEKIYFYTEFIAFVSYKIQSKYFKKENVKIAIESKELTYNFIDSQNSVNTEFTDWFNKYFNNLFGERFSKSETFYLTFYNKFIANLRLDEQKVKSSYDILKEKWNIKKKMATLFDIKTFDTYRKDEFIYLYLIWIFIVDTIEQNINFAVDVYESILEPGWKIKLKFYDNIIWYELLSNDINKKYFENINKEIYEYFYLNENVNKKNFSYKKTDLAIKNDLNLIKSWFEKVIKDMFDFTQSKNFHIFLEPLSIASKKFVNSNCSYWHKTDIWDELWKTLIEFKHRFVWKILDIDDFMVEFFESNMSNYWTLRAIKMYLVNMIWRKIDDNATYDLVFDERNLFKRLLVELARYGYIDLYWKTEKKDIAYMSWNGYWWSYWFHDNIETIQIFEPKYIYFKDFKLNLEVSNDNYISWNDVYLSLNTEPKLIQKLSFFSKLERLDSHIILSIWRDELIKAKNDYQLTSDDILKTFKTLKLDLPKNIELLIKSVDNQKSDLTILPTWIPIICENTWTFQEFLKLKMFSDYILYSDENLKLIIFSDTFKSLEKTLTKRKVIFQRKENDK